MLRRFVSAVALLALVTTPVVARTRLFCRYTGLEITDCAEQEVPGSPVVLSEGCCNRLVSRTLDNVLAGQQQEIAPPTLHLLAAISFLDPRHFEAPVERSRSAAAPTGPPLFVSNRALLI